jgi:dipeptidyl aminopeptidase/acylaminoacyl peptidase
MESQQLPPLEQSDDRAAYEGVLRYYELAKRAEWQVRDLPWSDYRYIGDPAVEEELAEIMARSPITMVDKIRTPLLVTQGAMDVRVVQAEADNIVNALRARGVPVEYFLAEDEGHGFQNPENIMHMFRLIEKHFAEHLGGRTTS